MSLKITVSAIKAVPLSVKSKFFCLTEKEAKNLERYGFKHFYEDDVFLLFKNKWHEISWVFTLIATLSAIVVTNLTIFTYIERFTQ